MNTNMHVTRGQARTMLTAVRSCLEVETTDDLLAAEQMLLAALSRIRDLETRRASVR